MYFFQYFFKYNVGGVEGFVQNDNPMEWNNVAVYAGFTSAANGRIKNLEYETIYYDQG